MSPLPAWVRGFILVKVEHLISWYHIDNFISQKVEATTKRTAIQEYKDRRAEETVDDVGVTTALKDMVILTSLDFIIE